MMMDASTSSAPSLPPLGGGGDVHVTVTYRGKVTHVSLAPDATVAHLGAALELATGASVATQKILGVKGLKGSGGGVLVPSKPEHAALCVAAVPGLSRRRCG